MLEVPEEIKEQARRSIQMDWSTEPDNHNVIEMQRGKIVIKGGNDGTTRRQKT